jgi:hypothetical protein
MLSAAHTVKLRLITISDWRRDFCIWDSYVKRTSPLLQLLNYYTSCSYYNLTQGEIEMLGAAHTIKLRLITIDIEEIIDFCLYGDSYVTSNIYPLQLLNYYTSCSCYNLTQGEKC